MPQLIEAPSWLTSWVAWRNHYTKPGDAPFTDLIEELGTGNFVGLSLAYNSKHKHCPHCDDQYIVVDDTWGLVYCVCQVLEFQEKQHWKYADIRSETLPAYLKDLEYPHYIGPVGVKTLKEAVKHAEQFIKRPERWLVFGGYYGTGKTHILRALNQSLYPMSVYVASRDLEDMVHSYRKDDSLGELYSALRYAPILLLDDYGMEYGGPLMSSVIDRIVDARYSRFPDFPMVIATNKRKEDLLEDEHTPRAGDRLLDSHKTTWVSLQGKSYRTSGVE